MRKKTKSEEAVSQLGDLITGDLKKAAKKKTKKGVVSFQVNRGLLSSALGIVDQLVSLSSATRTHVFISGKTMTIRATGIRRASVVLTLEDSIAGDISIQPELKTLLELTKKFSSKIISFSINIKTYQMIVKDKNGVTKLICNQVEIDPVEEVESHLSEVLLSLKGDNLTVFSKANLDSKLAGTAISNYSRILVYPESNTLSYYTTNGTIINGIEADKMEGDPITLDIENQEMMIILKIMDNIKNYSSVQIKTLTDSTHKFVDIYSEQLRVVFNISEIDSALEIEDILHQQEKKTNVAVKFIFLPYKFLDFLKKASPIIKNDKVDDLNMFVYSTGKVEMEINGRTGNVIKSKYNIEKLEGFPPDKKEFKVCLSIINFSIILGHYSSKPAAFYCMGNLEPGGNKLVFLKHEEDKTFISYKSLLATLEDGEIDPTEDASF